MMADGFVSGVSRMFLPTVSRESLAPLADGRPAGCRAARPGVIQPGAHVTA